MGLGTPPEGMMVGGCGDHMDSVPLTYFHCRVSFCQLGLALGTRDAAGLGR